MIAVDQNLISGFGKPDLGFRVSGLGFRAEDS